MYDSLDEPSEEEEDMLDQAFGLTTTSRLGCQIELRKDMDGIKVRACRVCAYDLLDRTWGWAVRWGLRTRRVLSHTTSATPPPPRTIHRSNCRRRRAIWRSMDTSRNHTNVCAFLGQMAR